MFQIPKFWSRYLIQYKRDINENIVEKSPDHGKESKGKINPIFERLALSSTGCTVSSCWDNKINLLKSWQMLVSIIARINIYVLITMVKMYVSFIPKTEKYLKCFFFSYKLHSGEIPVSLHNKRKMWFTTCAKILQKKCKSYDFDIDNSNCHANMIINLNVHKDDQSKDWIILFKYLVEVRSNSWEGISNQQPVGQIQPAKIKSVK